MQCVARLSATFPMLVPPLPVTLDHVDEHPLVLAILGDLRRPRQCVVLQEKNPLCEKVHHLKWGLNV